MTDDQARALTPGTTVWLAHLFANLPRGLGGVEGEHDLVPRVGSFEVDRLATRYAWPEGPGLAVCSRTAFYRPADILATETEAWARVKEQLHALIDDAKDALRRVVREGR